MELAQWLKSTDNFPVLNINSFATFIKVCEAVAEWALDDNGLANRNNAYKIWVCWIQTKDLEKLKEVANRYTSMKLLLHYLNQNIVENNKIGLYVKLDFINNVWMMNYGITNNKTLFKIGEFEYKVGTKLPESKIMKYILNDIEDFNPREHLLLYTIKRDFFLFDPGYCTRLDPQIIDNTVMMSTHNLGKYDNFDLVAGQAEEFMTNFKAFVINQKWWEMVHLIVKPRIGKWTDFIIQLK